ncbi:MAG: hypothetical protein GTN76_11230 [Candidatus Aenigmarchaeota archaeon]|nr:hypothetical protein [Candidatus Aenigmarchaeota archaeon]NIQ18001.1 hypothetical protein [Candidatus Aenigmarchaeota archaeon]
MIVMGTNTWERDIPKEFLITQALKFAEDVKSKGVAKLLGAWIENDKKLMWCSWKTENLEGLQAAFDEMNKRSGLKSELHIVEDMCSR